MLVKCLNEAIITEEMTRREKGQFQAPGFLREEKQDETCNYPILYELYVLYGDNLDFVNHVTGSGEDSKRHFVVFTESGTAATKMEEILEKSDQKSDDLGASATCKYRLCDTDDVTEKIWQLSRARDQFQI